MILKKGKNIFNNIWKEMEIICIETFLVLKYIFNAQMKAILLLFEKVRIIIFLLYII